MMKNHERLPVLFGDVDLCLGREHWDAFTDAIGASLEAIGSFKLIDCDHFLGVRLIFVVPSSEPAPEEKALEIDLADGVWWKGTPLCSAECVLSEFVASPETFAPHTRVGFQAALGLTVSGITRAGALDREAIENRDVHAKAREEPVIFAAAMEAFHGAAGRPAAQAFIQGGWSPATGLTLIAHRMRRSAIPFDRMVYLARRKAMGHWRGLPRRVPGSTADWLTRTVPGHRISVV
ncbi:MAG: hypothetical protein ACRD3V_08165 [Vicinamibacteria bacterium]